jgi:uncharacterized protein YkwD
MESSTRDSRSNTLARCVRAGLVAVVFTGTVLVSSPAAAMSDAELRMVRYVNHARTIRDIPRVKPGWRLARFAQRVANDIAAAGKLEHSNGPSFCREWGENIGVTNGSMWELHRAFMRSPGHRHNILNARFRRVGVGIKRAGGFRWVAVVFCR